MAKKSDKTSKDAATESAHTEAAADRTLTADLVATVTVGDAVLEATVPRAFQFLRGIGTSDAIRAVLAGAGYGPGDHSEGWRLLYAVSGAPKDEAQTAATTKEVSEAIAAVDAADEEVFGITQLALKHRFPEQAAFVFHDLAASRGPEAVLGMKVFLERIQALEAGREGHEAEDQAAVALLVKRGITGPRRTELSRLVAIAESYVAPKIRDAAAEKAAAAENLEKLRALRAWYEEWSGIARALIKRRDHRIRLGLAQRKSGGSDDTEDPIV